MQHHQKSAVDKNNWFKTGDVASIDPLGFMRITDRSKDVIKSGGEWISSIDIENAVMSHQYVSALANSTACPSVIDRPNLKTCHALFLLLCEDGDCTATSCLAI